MIKNCPLCGLEDCGRIAVTSCNALRYNCKTYNRSVIIGGTIEGHADERQQRRMLNLVFEHVLSKPYYDSNKIWHYYYEPSYRTRESDEPQMVDLAELHYPQTISEKIDRILINLVELYPGYAEEIVIEPELARALFVEDEDDEERMGIVSIMEELGYLVLMNPLVYHISAKGWQRIEDLQRSNNDIKQGFIAISFAGETEPIREAIKRAIKECGYSGLTINDKEHNNQIVPEIFYEIGRSKFVVMDITVPNFGAYYEAGYALGKGKEVIISCREAEFNSDDKRIRPHFDIAQKSTVVWSSAEDLVEKLKKRIEATVK